MAHPSRMMACFAMQEEEPAEFRPELQGITIIPIPTRENREVVAGEIITNIRACMQRAAAKKQEVQLFYDERERETEREAMVVWQGHRAVFRIPRPEQVLDFAFITLTGNILRDGCKEAQCYVLVPQRTPYNANIPQYIKVPFTLSFTMKDDGDAPPGT